MSTLRDRLAATRLRLAPWPPPSPSLVDRLLSLMAEWRRRARSRAELAALCQHQLRDIGLSPAERARECAKRFWQA